jgi:DNA topoisomerase II
MATPTTIRIKKAKAPEAPKATGPTASATGPTASDDVSEQYQKMEHTEHIYKKPDTYIGSCEAERLVLPILVKGEHIRVTYEPIDVVPGFYKCFDELAVNIHDHYKRQKMRIANKTPTQAFAPVTTMRITFADDGSIEFYNDGDGIDVVMLPKHNMYPAELIFGSLLTSTNYDDSQAREWGGRNGYGAKLANIFSRRFTVETVDQNTKLRFKMTWENNMTTKSPATVSKAAVKPFTRITWLPDYERFGLKDGLSAPFRALLERRAYDLAAVTDKTVTVWLGEQKIAFKNFEQYAEMIVPAGRALVSEETDGWSVVACVSDDDIFQQFSFVNGIFTSRGGTHVEYVADQIKTKLADVIKKKRKLDIKPAIIKNQLRLFINAHRIVNPTFDSQTKEALTTPKSKFGTAYEVSDKFIEKLYKSEITERIVLQNQYKEAKTLAKSDGKMRSVVRIPKLDDANLAGTKDSKSCTIIFTEGDSAKTMAISGLSVVGRDHYGVFPLRGKVLNVRNQSSDRIADCEEIKHIKQIIGLQTGKNYKDEYEKTGTWPLRYGRVMLMTDQDVDGSHIKGLILNIFDHYWPALIQMGFVCSLVTPIVKATKGKDVKSFYTLTDFETWQKGDTKGWATKYYKGLGTSSTLEAREYFRELKVVNFELDYIQPEDTDTTSQSSAPVTEADVLDLAFNKKRANDRKQWLGTYDRGRIVNYNNPKLPLKEFVNNELIHFSMEDVERSIPHIMDGLKPSQRKILFACFKRNLTSEIKVAQLAGYTSEHAAYHHGEKSLEDTIKNMAQNFVGSNNVNLLEPSGQFGSRVLGGKDAASSRYIFTRLTPNVTRNLFRKEDDAMCRYLDDDGTPIEPITYYPIIPMILVNGALGIGTGYSTSIPCYNPQDVIAYIQAKLAGTATPTLRPWYRGFKGTIEDVGGGRYRSRGTYKRLNDTTVQVTELPIGTWTSDYKEFLDKHLVERGKEDKKAFIRSFSDNSTEAEVNITIKLNEDQLYDWERDVKDGVTELEDRLGLISKISTGNMHLIDHEDHIRHYDTVDDIIDEWLEVRRGVMSRRREATLAVLQHEADVMYWKVRFIEAFIKGEVEIRNLKKAAVEELLRSKGFPEYDGNFDYILKMDLYKLTKEEIERLQRERDIRKAAYDDLKNKTAEQVWTAELTELREVIEKTNDEFLREYFSAPVTTATVKKGRKKA